MNAAAGSMSRAGYPPPPARSGPQNILDNPIMAGALFLLIACSSLVFVEPAPYDLLALGVMALFLSSGMVLSTAVAPLMLMVVFFVASGFIAATQSRWENEPFFYVSVTAFLALTSVFIAFVVALNPLRACAVIMSGYVVAAVITAIAGIGGYFDILPGSEHFLRFGRAKGTFEDPNVMGPFLVPPALFLIDRIIRSRLIGRPIDIGLLFIIVCAIFLCFSRGAWGYAVLASAIFVFLVFMTAATTITRTRIVLLSMAGVLAVAAALAWLATIDDVRVLLVERAQLVQSYDTGDGGRFARQVAGFSAIARHPLGLGPLTFGDIYGEDPHNIYIKAFSAYGWVAGIAYLSLIGTTLIYGARYCFRRTPWQPMFLVAFAAFAGLAALGLIIDTDRWRHFWLLIGVLWGMMAARPGHVAAVGRHHAAIASRAGHGYRQS